MTMSITVQIISISITSTTVVMLLVTVLAIVFILVVKCVIAHNQQTEHIIEPIYEEIDTLNGSRQGPSKIRNPAAIELEINCSYGDIKTCAIKVTENLAYGQIEICSQQQQ